MLDRIEEIQSFLSHRDYSLARRRMLDLSLDADNRDLLKEAIRWSQTYNAALQGGNSTNEEAPVSFLTEAEALLARLKSYQQDTNRTAEPLLIAKNISKKYARGNLV